MAYEPSKLPDNPSPEVLVRFIMDELRAISVALSMVEGILLKEMHIVPSKPRTGLIVLADGTDWNPGAGAGVYAYYAAGWHKLG